MLKTELREIIANGAISGLQRPDMEEWVMNVFADKVHPLVLPFYEEVNMGEAGRVAVLTFPQGNSKPYVRRHKDAEENFIRVGSTSRLATREQQMRLRRHVRAGRPFR